MNHKNFGSILFRPPVINYMLLHSTLLCKKIARAPGGHKNLCSLSWGGGGGQNRSKISYNMHFIFLYDLNNFET